MSAQDLPGVHGVSRCLGIGGAMLSWSSWWCPTPAWMGSIKSCLGTGGDLWTLSIRLCNDLMLQSQVAWEISSHGTPVSESWSVLHLAVTALFIACTALGQICHEFVLARHHTRAYPNRSDHSSCGDLCFLRSMHSHKWARQTNIITLWLAPARQDTLPFGEAVEPVRWHPAAIFLTWQFTFSSFFLGSFKFKWPTLALPVVHDL